MTLLDNDLVNTIQAERRAQAYSERAANAVRPTAARQATSTTPRRSARAWGFRNSMPTWARLVLARW